MASLSFNWSHINPDDSNITFNLYENGTKVIEDISQLKFTLLMDSKEQGNYEYYVTAFDEDTRLESIPSNKVSVNFTIPDAPIGLSASWS